jgi:1,4-alpha-glucan branching enzyme
MGEEFGARTPFLFFCDFGPELAAKVTAGRRSEFAKFALFHSPQAQARIPDPNSEATFLASKLDWSSLDEGEHKQWMVFYRDLLMCRRKHIVPRIARIASAQKQFRVLGDRIVSVSWLFTSGGSLNLFANFSNLAIRIPELQGSLLYSTPPAALQQWTLVPLSATWLLDE